MTSFVEFIIRAFDYFGVFYVFAIILIGSLTYIISKFLLDSFVIGKGDQAKGAKKESSIISLFIAVSVAFLSIYVPNVIQLLQYFLAMTSIFLIVVFFVITYISFISGQRKTPSGGYSTAVSILVILTLMIFAFVAFFFAYQEAFIRVNVGEGSGTVNLFGLIWRPEIVLIIFLFVIIGLGVMIVGREAESSKKKE